MKSPVQFTIHVVDRGGNHKKTGATTLTSSSKTLFDQLPATIKDNGDHYVDVMARNKIPLDYEHMKNHPRVW